MVFLNGEFMPLEEARVPVLDRGFIFGDGVYEVIPVYSRVPFRLDEHLRACSAAWTAIRLAIRYSARGMARHHPAAGRASSRRGPVRLLPGHARRRQARPRVPEGRRADGVHDVATRWSPRRRSWSSAAWRAVTRGDNRWLRCDIKSISLLGNCLLRQLAVDAGAAETILFRDGFLTEASA